MEELYVFGTGNAQATRCYNTCFAIKDGDEFFMVDAGGGNGILGILEKMNVDMAHIHHIFVTHEHTDHILGVVWMVRMIATAMKKGKYEGELRIYCHPGLADTISTLCRLTLQGKFYKMIGEQIFLIPVEDGETVSILDYDVIPIINENDTLAVDEIKVGDNDTLSALLLPIVDAQLLVLVSDIDGLYNDNPHTNSNAKLLSDIELVDDKIMNYAKDSSSQFGTGGMVTKLRAAKIVNDYGGDMAIVNGNNETALIDLLEGKQIGTYFSGKAGRTLSARDHWIMYRSSPKGKVIVDDGACEALKTHTSLLPKGIKEVEGSFMQGSIIDVLSFKGQLIARGITNYSSDELKLIKDHHSNEIESILHYKDYDEVIHADNLVINKG